LDLGFGTGLDTLSAVLDCDPLSPFSRSPIFDSFPPSRRAHQELD